MAPRPSGEKVVRFWNVDDGKELGKFQGATDAVVSTASFVLIAGGSIAVAMLAAAFPAWVAARSHPTRALRAE